MTHLVRDGVRLWYTEAGSRNPPIVLVHGWCCDHTYLQPQLDHLSASHRVVAVDLRGHGRSDRPQQPYTVEGFAEDVVWIARQLRLSNVVLIGHSLGAITGLQAAALHPELFAAVVLLDPSPVVLPPGLAEMARPFIEALHGPRYREAARQHVEEILFATSDDQELKARVADAMTATTQHVMASAMAGIFAWDGESAAKACQVPVAMISGSSPFTDVARFRELCPQLMTGQTIGSGHFIPLLVPEQVNAMIDRFLELLKLGAAASPRGEPAAG